MKVDFKWHKYPEEKPSESKYYVLLQNFRYSGSMCSEVYYSEDHDSFGYFDASNLWRIVYDAKKAKANQNGDLVRIYWAEIPAEDWEEENHV